MSDKSILQIRPKEEMERMGNRRMFSCRIVSSAKFLKMPISSQALYFHLGVNADDDGVVEAYSIIKQIGCSEDDLRVLVAKGFVQILNDDLVSYITDWNENNYIRADRKIDSIYKDLLVSMIPEVKLIEKRPRADAKPKAIDTTYSEIIDKNHNGQPMDVQWTTNGLSMDGVSKDKLSKDKLIKDKGIVVSKKRVNYQEIVDLYNDTCVSFPVLKELSEKSKKAIKARLNKYSIEQISLAFQKAQASDFLKGANQRNWIANFEWIMQDSNMAKILNGNYDNRNGHVNVKNSFKQNNYDFDALEKELIKN